MSHASQQYAFTEPRTVKRAQVKPSEREHQTSSSAPRVSLAPAADRTLDILEFIASNGQTQAATLARELGIPRSTVYQLLEILERHGLVTRLAEQRAYGIGLKTFELGSAYSRQHRVSQVAHPVLARLVDETGENGHLAVLHGNEIIYVIEERAAHRPPLVSGAGGRPPPITAGEEYAEAVGQVVFQIDTCLEGIETCRNAVVLVLEGFYMLVSQISADKQLFVER